MRGILLCAQNAAVGVPSVLNIMLLLVNPPGAEDQVARRSFHTTPPRVSFQDDTLPRLSDHFWMLHGRLYPHLSISWGLGVLAVKSVRERYSIAGGRGSRSRGKRTVSPVQAEW